MKATVSDEHIGSQVSQETALHTKPMVSIIIIFLNAEQFIQEAIESVLAQTYHNWELLLVDDGSTDGGTEIARRYAEQYAEKIHYLEHQDHQNRGMSASRNLGIENGKGEYLAFLDADDVWFPDKLEHQVTFMESHCDIGLLVNNVFMWFENGTKRPLPMTLLPGRLPPGTWLPKMLENDVNAACPSAVLMRMNLAIQLRGFEESFRGPLEDQVMWAKITLQNSVYYNPECVILYRIHPSSCCQSTPLSDRPLLNSRFYLWLLGYLRSLELRRSNTKLFSLMVQAKLLPTLLEFVSQSSKGTDNLGIGSWLSRFRKSLDCMHTSGYSPDYLFIGLLLFGTISRGAASALSNTMFVFSYVAYDEGFLRALKTLPLYLIRGIKEILPRPAKTIAKRWLGSIRTTKSRMRSIVGTLPLSQVGGWDRGTAINRYYLEQFLQTFSSDLSGYCLEFQEDRYSSHFGGDKIAKLDIIHKDEGNYRATIVADLTKPNNIPSNTYDCIICTYVLHMVFELDKVVSELYRILKPNGVLLVAVPHISRTWPSLQEFWRFTPEGLHLLLAKAFGSENVMVQAFGNSLTAAGFIRGLVAEEFTQVELDHHHDPDFAVGVFARACKAN